MIRLNTMRNTLTRPAAVALLALLGSVIVAAPPSNQADAVDVSIKNLTFIPETVTIKAGQTVRWTNNDDRDYLLVARDQSFKSDNLRPKEKFEHKFTEVGKVEYSCALHPRLLGTIIIEEK